MQNPTMMVYCNAYSKLYLVKIIVQWYRAKIAKDSQSASSQDTDCGLVDKNPIISKSFQLLRKLFQPNKQQHKFNFKLLSSPSLLLPPPRESCCTIKRITWLHSISKINWNILDKIHSILCGTTSRNLALCLA